MLVLFAYLGFIWFLIGTVRAAIWKHRRPFSHLIAQNGLWLPNTIVVFADATARSAMVTNPLSVVLVIVVTMAVLILDTYFQKRAT